MQLFATPSGQGPYANGPSPPRGLLKIGRIGRLCLPVVALIGIGIGVSNYLSSQSHSQYSLIQEEQRLKRNAQLMDAYGDKTSLEDIQRALDQYKGN